MKTFSAKSHEVTHDWFVVDADNKVLGRLASEIAMILIGKNKPSYTPNVDNGDIVQVSNVSKLEFSGKKLTDKVYYKHLGWLGHLRQKTAGTLQREKPTEVLRHAVVVDIPAEFAVGEAVDADVDHDG